MISKHVQPVYVFKKCTACIFFQKVYRSCTFSKNGIHINYFKCRQEPLVVYTRRQRHMACFFCWDPTQKRHFSNVDKLPPEKKGVRVRVAFLFLFAIKILQDIWWNVCCDVFFHLSPRIACLFWIYSFCFFSRKYRVQKKCIFCPPYAHARPFFYFKQKLADITYFKYSSSTTVHAQKI